MKFCGRDASNILQLLSCFCLHVMTAPCMVPSLVVAQVGSPDGLKSELICSQFILPTEQTADRNHLHFVSILRLANVYCPQHAKINGYIIHASEGCEQSVLELRWQLPATTQQVRSSRLERQTVKRNPLLWVYTTADSGCAV